MRIDYNELIFSFQITIFLLFKTLKKLPYIILINISRISLWFL